MPQVLLLGGTLDAHVLSTLLQAAGVRAIYSYAGVTQTRRTPALPTRVGGFGGVEGLVQYLREQRITQVIDATHPFAAQMSRNAIGACAALGIPLLAMERPAWQAQPGDQWQHVPDMAAAAEALAPHMQRVFLAIGRKQLAAFAPQAAPRRFVLRIIDKTGEPLPLPASSYELLIARGPFALADERALLQRHAIDCIVSKNAGGADTYAKIGAARELGVPVVMVDRPQLPARLRCETPQQAMQWLAGQR
ncbi:cobalt-precorrin-6A reductase [Comamonas endophytica]|uniref:Cobalt-precorrin-6A reductase n=1 Tax=Comamonas endophytica TaxID=2949090 RepID=A0ABY6G734_9BURK|nr:MULTISPECIES: cobalt-precorrin-6A reductase [unclassified Acidovorax]MCD2511443.1 cobalt-precorrin-6A reductase [Acidovorax sp. D4N7]UYG50834.1 cobalt-precorrin-6A reductase [Acidovorax sp. 5MLIR]